MGKRGRPFTLPSLLYPPFFAQEKPPPGGATVGGGPAVRSIPIPSRDGTAARLSLVNVPLISAEAVGDLPAGQRCRARFVHDGHRSRSQPVERQLHIVLRCGRNVHAEWIVVGV